MAKATVAANLLEPLDVERDLSPQIAFDAIIAVNIFTQSVDMFFGEVLDPNILVDSDSRKHFLACSQAYAENIGQ
jgi:hypothetical protein